MKRNNQGTAGVQVDRDVCKRKPDGWFLLLLWPNSRLVDNED